MNDKKILINKLNDLSDKGFMKYLIKTGWCMRELLEHSIEKDWSETEVSEELEFLSKKNI